jgi:hypothetical protein
LRAPYANLVAVAKNRETLLGRAEQNLSEARASQASAKASSLISLIDTPDTGVTPIGPGKTLIVLVGLVGGLLLGLGILVLTLQAVPTTGATPRAADLPRYSLPVQNGLSLGKALKKASNGKFA